MASFPRGESEDPLIRTQAVSPPCHIRLLLTSLWALIKQLPVTAYTSYHASRKLQLELSGLLFRQKSFLRICLVPAPWNLRTCSEFPHGALYISNTLCCHFKVNFSGLFVNSIFYDRLGEKLSFYDLSETLFSIELTPELGTIFFLVS